MFSNSANVTSNNLLIYNCTTITLYINTCVSALRIILLLPLCSLVLYLGRQQWQQKCSFNTASHSDICTYHVAAMELIWVLGIFIEYGGIYTSQTVIQTVGSFACLFTYYGEIIFHVLTCVDRYLAVVHPIIYLGLRNARGARIRNITTGCAWVLCFGLAAIYTINNSMIMLFCFLALCLLLISFCSLSVLWVLIHPGPGQQHGEKEKHNQSKVKAFYNITAITCVVWLWFLGLLAYIAMDNSPLLSSTVKCAVQMSTVWFNLPSTLVLPLLYLHKIGKLSCCLYNNE